MTIEMNREEEIVIVGAYRTPIGKAKKGCLSTVRNDYLVSELIKGTLENLKIHPDQINEIVFGHCLSPLNGTTSLRIGALRAGMPLHVPVSTVNRQCGSGLEAMSIIYNKLRLDQIKIGLGGGFESMTGYSLVPSDAVIMKNDKKEVVDSTLSMGETAEILARKHNVSRSKCDVYAFTSHLKALEAQRKGLFTSEIVPVRIGNNIVKEDDCLRKTTLEQLKGLKPVFQVDGVCTAGNSCQLSDGASSILMMKRKTAVDLNLQAKGVMVDYVVVGLEPSVMGEGPVPAIKLLLEKNSLTLEEISYFEINEAFACQVVYCIEELGIDYKKVNLYGGSIALGHPLGSTGSKLVCTLLNVMEREDIKGYGIVSMCIGTGLGVAILIRRD